MRYVCLLILSVGILAAQDGAAIYKERCASCHDAAEGRAPKMDALKGMTGEAVYVASVAHCAIRVSIRPGSGLAPIASLPILRENRLNNGS
jgi:mono/diheme cytochrome c family protein